MKTGFEMLPELAARWGTPLFVYDTSIIDRQYQRLVNAFKGQNVQFNYACKALSNPNILKYFKALGTGLDTVSIEEVKLGLMAGFDPKQILFTPNCVDLSEIEEAINLGVQINIDNLSILEQFGSRYGDSVPVCVRMNPHILAGGHQKISTGHIDSKFGISIHQNRHLQRIIKHYNIHVNGLHMHTGSDILDVDVFLRGAQVLMDLAFDFPALEYIDFGSGFKVPYRPGERGTNVEELGEKMGHLFSEFCNQYGRSLALAFEPGKWLVSEAGYFLARVNVVKHTTSTVFAGVNSGFNHFIRPMLYDAYHHILNLSNPKGVERIYTVVGYICETDTFAWDRPLPEVREGDILCFLNAGAYLYSMSSNYNARLKPAEVLVHREKDYLISRRQTLDDLLTSVITCDLEY
ncbi:MAG: diaminopimelate decarboxylase [Thermaurantimonas sp.]